MIKPFVIYDAYDYHEFKSIVHYFKAAGISLEYKELGVHGGNYVAVFWERGTAKKFTEEIKIIKDEYKEEDDF